jgi:hypothetical protein
MRVRWLCRGGIGGVAVLVMVSGLAGLRTGAAPGAAWGWRAKAQLPSAGLATHVPTEGVTSSCSGCLVIEHWNGTGWHPQEVRVNPRDSQVLWSAAATSPRDAWAVGNYGQYPDVQRTWIVRWDGTTWTHVPSPNPGGLAINELLAVAATSRVDAWAVGWSISQSYTGGTGRSKTLIEHWDGTNWVRVPAPSPGFYAYLSGVAASSPDNAWAVGASDGGALIEHWDGTAWTRVPSPSPGPSGDVLYGVAATSPTSAWAVGGSDGGTLIEHWNGTAWTQVPSPSPGPASSVLYGVAATSPTSAWAVGYHSNRSGSFVRALIEHWNGTAWTAVSTSSPFLRSVTATSPANAWAV